MSDDDPTIEDVKSVHVPSKVKQKGDQDTSEDDFEAQWNDLDEKVILAQILTELQQIRLLLSDAETDRSRDREPTTTYTCTKCEATVPADKREHHARAEHNAPPGMAEGLFEEVSE